MHRKKGELKFLPQDFAEVFSHLPEGCPVVGGQAVAWWASKYGITGEGDKPITSGDIDFWGGREDLDALARALHRRPILPDKREMTFWVGAVEIRINGEQTLAEFLHVVPGLDIPYPEKASIRQEFSIAGVNKTIPVLTPISLALTKLYALWRFNQENRFDALHLEVCLKCSRAFLSELLGQQEVRLVLRDCERLITAHESSKAFRRLETEYQFSILSGIPVEAMKQASVDRDQSAENRARLSKFLELRWKRVIKSSESGGSSGTK